ncbi:MAG TPA: hypothetical protein VF805_15025 [Anaeromyxobacteraceae bacterium]
MAPRGRIERSAGPRGVRTVPASLLLAALVAAGCGGLSSPDLGTGQVDGRLSGAKPGAYAYVLGAPSLKAQVQDGAFRLERVPVGSAQVVVFDGEARAGVVSVEVRPAARALLELSGADMPLAGRVVPVPRPAGGASGAKARMTVEGTEFVDVPADLAGGLFPLPSGGYSVRAALRGFKDWTNQVEVLPAVSLPVEMQLDVDDSALLRGCLGGAPCGPGLVCSRDDGRCYGCITDADCGGAACSDHVCTNQPLGCGGACGACGAGLACVASTCQAPAGCAAWLQGFGSECALDATCALALKDGRCFVPPGALVAGVGYCTAPCASDADCPTLGTTRYTCDAVAQVCVR